VDIQKPGWYPLVIKYFNRTGTAAQAQMLAEEEQKKMALAKKTRV